jgi:hypothetical protein
MKKTLLLLLALLAPALVQAQEATALVTAYQIDGTTFTCCRTNPQDISGVGNIKTTGSSTTVNAVSGTPFAPVSTGDVITVMPGAGASPEIRYVVNKVSNIQVTVDTAVNWENGGAGFSFVWRDVRCGTGAEDGWVSVPPNSTPQVQMSVNAITGTSVDFKIEGRIRGTAVQPANLGNFSYTAVGGDTVKVLDFVDQLRVCMKMTGDAGGNESISIHLSGRVF